MGEEWVSTGLLAADLMNPSVHKNHIAILVMINGLFKNQHQGVILVINKECNAFDGTLTKEQYFDLLSHIQPLVDKEENEDLKNILAYSCYLIYKKSEIFEGDS